MDDLTTSIIAKLKEKIGATYVEVEDCSRFHLHHAEGGSGHYQLTIVSPLFRNLGIIQQHRSVYNALHEEMGTTIHALALKCFTPEEWQER
ncbi:MAG: BolA family transcriptional regulator [Cyanobacteria bacterium KgW148]|nr:BolA family transcriptional regulator [Cyanobacteria bacterium KgW148]